MLGVFQSQPAGSDGIIERVFLVLGQALQVELSAAPGAEAITEVDWLPGAVETSVLLPRLMMTAPPTTAPAMMMPAEMMAAGIHRRFADRLGAAG